MWPLWKTPKLSRMHNPSSLGAAVSLILERFESGALHRGFRAAVESGSASGVVSVEESPDDPGVEILLVRLPIMRTPSPATEAFLSRLLSLNLGFRGRAAFCVDDRSHVVLCAGRNLHDLEPDELIDLIIWTAEQADLYDDVLLGEFGYEHALNPDHVHGGEPGSA